MPKSSSSADQPSRSSSPPEGRIETNPSHNPNLPLTGEGRGDGFLPASRYPLADAAAVAAALVAILAPFCEPGRCLVAGSIRRKKFIVGDIEILYVSRYDRRQVAPDLFPRAVPLADLQIEAMIRDGTLAKRPNINGQHTWGDCNKFAVHRASGIPVDLFATTADAWHNYLVCRTGGATNNKTIATAAKVRGWKWHPYGRGFSAGVGEIIVRAERDVFDHLGLPYLEPADRL